MRGLAANLDLLRERPFRLLFLAQAVSALGDALVPVAIAFAVLDLTGSASQLGLVLAAFMGSRVVFILAGGVWSDRLPRHRVMIGADVLRAVVQGLLAAVFFLDAAALWHLVAGAALVGGASAFFGPASTGLVKTTVRAERLQEANALIGLSQSAAFLAGPAVSGLLVAAFGFGIVFALDSATFVVSFLFLAAMRLPRLAPAGRRPFLADVRVGLAEVARRRWLWTAFVTFSLSNVAIAAYFVLGPLVVERELGGAPDWGLILTGGALGGLAGGAVALRWRPRRPLVPAFVVLLAVSLQLLALVPPLPVPVLMLAAAAAVGSIALGNALWDAMLQQHVPPESISRVSSLDWLVSLVFMPLGYLVAGPAADAFGTDATLIGAAAVAAAANLGVLLVPEVRSLARVDAAGEPAGETAHGPALAEALATAEPAPTVSREQPRRAVARRRGSGGRAPRARPP